MRKIDPQSIDVSREVNTGNSDYLRGYRDGIKDRKTFARPASGDGLLGALLAIALMAGIGYFGYNYATTGRVLPGGVDLQNPLPQATVQ